MCAVLCDTKNNIENKIRVSGGSLLFFGNSAKDWNIWFNFGFCEAQLLGQLRLVFGSLFRVFFNSGSEDFGSSIW